MDTMSGIEITLNALNAVFNELRTENEALRSENADLTYTLQMTNMELEQFRSDNYELRAQIEALAPNLATSLMAKLYPGQARENADLRATLEALRTTLGHAEVLGADYAVDEFRRLLSM